MGRSDEHKLPPPTPLPYEKFSMGMTLHSKVQNQRLGLVVKVYVRKIDIADSSPTVLNSYHVSLVHVKKFYFRH